jgi:hypothetical protein
MGMAAMLPAAKSYSGWSGRNRRMPSRPRRTSSLSSHTTQAATSMRTISVVTKYAANWA